MTSWFKKLFAAPVFKDPDRARVGQLIHTILWVFLALAILVPPATLVISPIDFPITLSASVIMGAISVGLMVLLRQGRLELVGALLAGSLFVGVTLSLFGYRGIRDLTVTGYFVTITFAGLLLGRRAVLVFGLGSMLASLVAYYAEATGLLQVRMEEVVPSFQMMSLLLMLGLLILLLQFAVGSIAQAFRQSRQAARALSAANEELKRSSEALQLRTRDLEQRSTYLEASAKISRVATSILESDLLIERVVDLIQTQFGLYYVGLFLLDSAGEWAVLRSGTGEAGRALLARGHRIRVGEGMIGWTVARRQARIALLAEQDRVRLAVPELSETQSEAALPLRSRGQILGALSVQSTQPDAFDQDTVVVLQTMADQIAVALDNARLFAESQAALEAERRAYGEISHQAWAEMVRGQAALGYVARRDRAVQPVVGSLPPDMIQASETEKTVQHEAAEVAIPIKIREQVEGVVHLRKPAEAGDWTAHEVALMETLTRQLEVALDSARLYQDTQRRAAQEQLLSEVTARMRETLDMRTVLRSAAQEIGTALGLVALDVRLGAEIKEIGTDTSSWPDRKKTEA